MLDQEFRTLTTYDQEASLLQVFNVVPSISAVTGISPGRYLWRIVIAFHLGPRLLIAAVYYNFLMSFAKVMNDPEKAEWLAKLLKGCYYLQICEIVGLCGISFIHNREHYRNDFASTPLASGTAPFVIGKAPLV